MRKVISSWIKAIYVIPKGLGTLTFYKFLLASLSDQQKGIERFNGTSGLSHQILHQGAVYALEDRQYIFPVCEYIHGSYCALDRKISI